MRGQEGKRGSEIGFKNQNSQRKEEFKGNNSGLLPEEENHRILKPVSPGWETIRKIMGAGKNKSLQEKKSPP